MTYLWFKALHVAAVLTFLGGMLAAALLLAGPHPARQPAALAALRRWDRTVTTPAMLLVWGLGLTLALRGGWFSSRWLPIKLVLVVILSGLHGVQSGLLRRMAGDPARPLAAWHLAPPIIVALAAAIAVLVVVKPS